MKMQIARPLILNYIASPYGISILSTLIFLAAWVFPPHLYTDLVREPDLMFLDAETLLYFILCIAGFWIGLLLIDFLFPAPSLTDSNPQTLRLGGISLILPLMLTTGLTAFTGFQILKASPNLLLLLFAQEGNTVKSQEWDVQLGAFGWAANIQTAFLCWTYWQLSNPPPGNSRRPRWLTSVYWLIFGIGIIVEIGICVLRVSRGDLIPLFAGLGILYVIGKIQRGEIKLGGLLRYFVIFSVFILSLFLAFGFLRGASDANVGFEQLVGYTFASYNRLTAILRGTMKYPYAGHGIYLFTFLDSNNLVNALIPVRKTFGWPDHFTLWFSEFQAPQIAGLRPELIWSGTFGYLFSEFGWATPLILGGYGMVYAIFWRQAKSGITSGIVLYPYFATGAIMWFSLNGIFDSGFPFYIIAALVLTAYERVMSLKIL
jgi:hypothetical protein